MHINVSERLEGEWSGSAADQADHAHCREPSEKQGSEAAPGLCSPSSQLVVSQTVQLKT